MKNTVSMFVAALLGGAIALGGYKTLLKEPFNNSNAITAPISHVNYDPNFAFNPNNNYANGGVNNTSFDFTQAAAKTMPAVVHIKSKQLVKNTGNQIGKGRNPFEDWFGQDFFSFGDPFGGGQQEPREGTGSGVIISSDGFIVTNNHVVENADEVEVTLFDKRTFAAKVIGTDHSTDLALLKIEDRNLPILPLADSDDARVGEWVLAVGNPFNLTSTVTAGIVSAKGRNISIIKDQAPIESFIQTDAAINPGNSGGALVDATGNLLGINTAIATPTGTYAGYGFAVPVNIVKKVIEDLKQYGIVQRGFLGIEIRDVDGVLAKEKELNVSQGVYVNKVTDDGAAKLSGIQADDVITKIDNKEVTSVADLQEMVGRHSPGDVINITVNRNGKDKNLTVTLKNKSGNTDVVTKSTASTALDVLGVQLEDLNAKDLQKMKIANGVRIAAINDGKLKKHTDIETGFIITKIDRKAVNSIKDVEKALQNKESILIEGIYPGYTGTYYYGIGLTD